MTATATPLDRPIAARSPLAGVVSRAIAALANAIDRAQLGPARSVEIGRHTGARI